MRRTVEILHPIINNNTVVFAMHCLISGDIHALVPLGYRQISRYQKGILWVITNDERGPWANKLLRCKTLIEVHSTSCNYYGAECNYVKSGYNIFQITP
jgi:hypothetical protein